MFCVCAQGFNFPAEAGYPLDPSAGARFYMMETHYNNPNIDQGVVDSSGVRILYTPTLRKYDAGVISVGLDPNWKHIIPPGRPEVVSEGHCIADCTRQALPEGGVNVFATLLHTHLIGTDTTTLGSIIRRFKIYWFKTEKKDIYAKRFT